MIVMKIMFISKGLHGLIHKVYWKLISSICNPYVQSYNLESSRETCTKFEFGILMRLWKNKTSITKGFNMRIVSRRTKQSLKRWQVMNEGIRMKICGMNSSLSNSNLKTLMTIGRDQHSLDRVQNMLIFMLNTTILLRSFEISSMINSIVFFQKWLKFIV